MDVGQISALAVGLAFVIGVIFMKPDLRTVPQEERLVIYRMGHFDHIAGPGLVLLWLRIDKIQRAINVREQPTTYTVDNLFIYGVPIALTFSIWSAFDPVQAAGDDHAGQMRLVVFSEYERQSQVILALRNILVQELGAIEQTYPLPAQATMGDRILPIIPGLPVCNRMLENLRNRLQADMRTIGFVLNPTRPILITGIKPPESVMKGFDRERVMSFLRPQFPNLPDDVLAQLYTSIEKLDLPTLQRFVVQNESGNLSTRIEQRTANAQGGQTRITMQTPMAGDAANVAAQPPVNATPAAPRPAPAPSPAADELRPSDLTVLKRVPRGATADQRRVA
ncbi:MAG: SPFH domain-containing protein [Anaerolineae bacterium]